MAIPPTEFKGGKRDDIPDVPDTSNVKQFLKYVRMCLGGYGERGCDAKGMEYRQTITPTGTSETTYSDGTTVVRRNGKTSVYFKSGAVVTSDENYDVKVSGHGSMQVKGGMHMEIVGDTNIVVNGSATMAVTENFAMAGENVYLGARGNFNINSKGNFQVDAKGTSTIGSDGNMTLATKGSMARSADGDIYDAAATVNHNKPGDPLGTPQVEAKRNTDTPSTDFA